MSTRFPRYVTGCMGENHFAALPTARYGGVLLAAIAYTILTLTISASQEEHSTSGSDGLYVTVVLLWLIPDRRIGATLE